MAEQEILPPDGTSLVTERRGRGRTSYVMGHEHREKIKNSRVLADLIGHVEGRVDMSPSQVTAGLGLLKKVLPDLASIEFSGTVEHDATDALKDMLNRVAQRGHRLAGVGNAETVGGDDSDTNA